MGRYLSYVLSKRHSRLTCADRSRIFGFVISALVIGVYRRGLLLRLLSLPAALAILALASGCSGSVAWVEPSEPIFKGKETLPISVGVQGPEEYKIIIQRIFEPEEKSNFKLESECVGKVLKPKEGEVQSCLFEIKGTEYEKGREAGLEQEIEIIKTKVRVPICNVVKMT
jgi:hypothetical protein